MKNITTLLTLTLSMTLFSQIDYDTQIQPIFDTNCVSCHSNGAAYTGGIELTSYDVLMNGGYTTNNTNVLDVLEEYIITGYMPAGEADPLSDEEINLISLWIDQGGNNSVNGNDGCTDPVFGDFYSIGEEWTVDLGDEGCWYYECLDNNQWSDLLSCSEAASCTLSDGTNVLDGWQGYGAGNNWCNTCFCDNGILSCTEMECESNCENDVDGDGICEDDCPDDMPTLVFDCECSFFDPYTYTVFETTINEEYCEIWEECYCECINDINNNNWILITWA